MLLQACSGDKSTIPSESSPTDSIATITLSPANPTIPLGNSLPLVAVLANDHGAPLTNRIVEWTSSRPEVAHVDHDGVVHALELGSATITATSEFKTATTDVTVIPPAVAGVTITPVSATVGVGRTVQLTAVVTDAHGVVLTGRFVQWTSSNPTTTVDDTGLVTGVVLGTSTIFAICEGVVTSATVVVVPN